MKKAFFIVLGIIGGASAYGSPAAPVVSNVSWSQEKSSREISVSYTVDCEAIVTADVLTNGVSIGAANLVGMSGDVNKQVAAGTHSISWKPFKTWSPGFRLSPEATVRVTAWATNAPPDYFVGNLEDFSVAYYTSLDALPEGGLTNNIYRRTRLVLKRVHAGFVRWRMGSTPNECGRSTWYTNQAPRYVTLTSDYYLGIYPVTERQLSLATGGWGYRAQGVSDMRPLTALRFTDLRGSNLGSAWPAADLATGYQVDSGSYIKAIRSKFGYKYLFDLPTEAQWEFACRAGQDTGLFLGYDTSDQKDTDLNQYARWSKNYNSSSITDGTKGGTAIVGSYKPNPWGFYDMIGNVREWCLDRYGDYEENAITIEEQIDPLGPKSGSNRLTKGGCYSDGWNDCRANTRAACGPTSDWGTNGFRLCIPLFR